MAPFGAGLRASYWAAFLCPRQRPRKQVTELLVDGKSLPDWLRISSSWLDDDGEDRKS